MAVLVAAGLGFAWRCSATEADEHQTFAAARPLPVNTVIAEPVDAYQLRRSYTGTLVAGRSSEPSFERAGKLLAVEVEEGARVTAGETLAVLDTRHLLAQRQQLEAERSQAVAVLEELEAGPRKEAIDAARAELRNLKAQLQLRQLDYQRAEKLLRSKAVSQAQFDEATFGVRSSAARAEAVERKLEELLAGTRDERLKAQRAAVDILDASLADLAIDIEDSIRLAPFDGTVAKRYVDEGTVVSPASPIVRLVEDQKLEARIGLPVHSAARLETGQTHEVIVSGQSHRAKRPGEHAVSRGQRRTGRIARDREAGKPAARDRRNQGAPFRFSGSPVRRFATAATATSCSWVTSRRSSRASSNRHAAWRWWRGVLQWPWERWSNRIGASITGRARPVRC